MLRVFLMNKSSVLKGFRNPESDLHALMIKVHRQI